MSGRTNRAQLAAAFAAIYLLWGGTYLAIALGLQSIPPFLLVGSRSILAGSVLFAFSQLRGLAVRPWRDWSHAAISGVLCSSDATGRSPMPSALFLRGCRPSFWRQFLFGSRLSTSQSVKANHCQNSLAWCPAL
jgi:hypothetical protein